MRVPRRTPYERPEALGELYSLLYPGEQHTIVDEEGYRRQRSQGLAVVQLWLNRSACPFAVESTGSLIHAQVLDENLLLQLPARNSLHSGPTWVVRSAYAMAVLRFVNSIADTFQTTLYAQSIFQISQRIGLPIWLVELRHAATHEEMPSLQVLRDACRASLFWLQQHFWQPTLAQRSLSRTSRAESSTMGESSLQGAKLQATQHEAATQLRKNLASYRRLAKEVVRDESLRGRSRTALTVAQNRVESCAKKVEIAFGHERDSVDQGEDWEQEEVTAAAFLVDVLLEPGGIIPLSKKKRSSHLGDAIAPVPPQLFHMWLPLLNHLSSAVDGFAEVLQEGLVGCITLPESTLGRTYLDTAASWIVALFGDDKPVLAAPKTASRHRLFLDSSEDDEGLALDKPTVLLARRCLTSPTATSLSVARQLCARDEVLMERIKPLLAMVDSQGLEVHGKKAARGTEVPPQAVLAASEESVKKDQAEGMSALEQSVLAMEKRLRELQDKPPAPASPRVVSWHPQAKQRLACQRDVCGQLPGWQLAPDDWESTPVGCLLGTVPHLLIP